MNRTERQINQIYNTIFKKVFNKTAMSELASGSRMPAMSNLIKLQNSKKFNEFAEAFSKELAKYGLSKQRGVWRKYYEAAKQAHVIALPQTYKDYELKTLANIARHNFTMIKSIPERMMEVLEHKYTSALIEEVAKGTTSRGSSG